MTCTGPGSDSKKGAAGSVAVVCVRISVLPGPVGGDDGKLDVVLLPPPVLPPPVVPPPVLPPPVLPPPVVPPPVLPPPVLPPPVVPPPVLPPVLMTTPEPVEFVMVPVLVPNKAPTAL